MKNKGLTLFELILLLALLAILLTFSLPIIKNIQDKQRLEGVLADIKQAITYARQRALLEGQVYLLKPYLNNDWSTGMRLLSSNKPIYHWVWKQVKVEWVGFRGENQIKWAPSLHHEQSAGHFSLVSGMYHQRLVLNRLGSMVKQDETSI